MRVSRLWRPFIVLAACLLFATGAAFANSKPQVGVAWYGKSGMAKSVLKGVQERLAEIAPQIQLDVRGELKDANELHEVATEFQNGGKDGMIILRSGGSVYLADHPPSISTFIGGNNHPVLLGAVDSMDAPGGNVTGVTYYIDLVGPLESFMLIAPQVRSFLLISQTDYPSSAIDGKGTLEACSALEVKCKQVFAVGEAEVIAAIEAEIGNYDAVILGNQAAVFGHAAAAVRAGHGKPVFSYAAKGVEGGALGGVIADDHRLGRLLADSIVEVVVNGKAISDVPIKMDPEPILVINMTSAIELQLEIPAELLSVARLIE